MKERVLLTGARTVIALEVARALHRAGHTVFIAETFPSCLTAFSRCVESAFPVPAPRFEPDAFIDRLLALIRAHRISRLIATGEEVLYIARARNRLAQACAVFCDQLEVLEGLHDKLRFQQLASAIGPVPKTWRLESSAQLAALQEQEGKLVLKQVYSRFGHQVVVLERDELAPTAAKLPASTSEAACGAWLAQKFIAGRELCSFEIAHRGRLVAHVCYEPRFRLPLGPSFYFQPVAHSAIETWARSFVRRYALTGSFAFDFIVASDGTPYPLECNPRCTSGAHLFPRDGSLAAALLDRGEAFPPPQRPAMWAWAMIGLGLSGDGGIAQLGGWLRAFLAARDVFWDVQDLRPALRMFASARHLKELSRKHGLSLREATTFYTEWNGPIGDQTR